MKKISLLFIILFLFLIIFPYFSYAAPTQEWINDCKKDCLKLWDTPECYQYCESGGDINGQNGTTEKSCQGGGDNYCLNVPMPGITSISIAKGANPFNQYFGVWYKFIIGSIGILATVMIMYAGFKWLTSRGNSGVIGDAKEKIFSAIIGLLLAFLSYTILNLINPKLVTFTSPNLGSISYSGNYNTGSLNFDQGNATYSGVSKPIGSFDGRNGLTESQFVDVFGEVDRQVSSTQEIPFTTDELNQRNANYRLTYQELRNKYPNSRIFPFFSSAMTQEQLTQLDPQIRRQLNLSPLTRLIFERHDLGNSQFVEVLIIE